MHHNVPRRRVERFLWKREVYPSTSADELVAALATVVKEKKMDDVYVHHYYTGEMRMTGNADDLDYDVDVHVGGEGDDGAWELHDVSGNAVMALVVFGCVGTSRPHVREADADVESSSPAQTYPFLPHRCLPLEYFPSPAQLYKSMCDDDDDDDDDAQQQQQQHSSRECVFVAISIFRGAICHNLFGGAGCLVHLRNIAHEDVAPSTSSLISAKHHQCYDIVGNWARMQNVVGPPRMRWRGSQLISNNNNNMHRLPDEDVSFDYEGPVALDASMQPTHLTWSLTGPPRPHGVGTVAKTLGKGGARGVREVVRLVASFIDGNAHGCGVCVSRVGGDVRTFVGNYVRGLREGAGVLQHQSTGLRVCGVWSGNELRPPSSSSLAHVSGHLVLAHQQPHCHAHVDVMIHGATWQRMEEMKMFHSAHLILTQGRCVFVDGADRGVWEPLFVELDHAIRTSATHLNEDVVNVEEEVAWVLGHPALHVALNSWMAMMFALHRPCNGVPSPPLVRMRSGLPATSAPLVDAHLDAVHEEMWMEELIRRGSSSNTSSFTHRRHNSAPHRCVVCPSWCELSETEGGRCLHHNTQSAATTSSAPRDASANFDDAVRHLIDAANSLRRRIIALLASRGCAGEDLCAPHAWMCRSVDHLYARCAPLLHALAADAAPHSMAHVLPPSLRLPSSASPAIITAMDEDDVGVDVCSYPTMLMHLHQHAMAGAAPEEIDAAQLCAVRQMSSDRAASVAEVFSAPPAHPPQITPHTTTTTTSSSSLSTRFDQLFDVVGCLVTTFPGNYAHQRWMLMTFLADAALHVLRHRVPFITDNNNENVAAPTPPLPSSWRYDLEQLGFHPFASIFFYANIVDMNSGAWMPSSHFIRNLLEHTRHSCTFTLRQHLRSAGRCGVAVAELLTPHATEAKRALRYLMDLLAPLTHVHLHLPHTRSSTSSRPSSMMSVHDMCQHAHYLLSGAGAHRLAEEAAEVFGRSSTWWITCASGASHVEVAWSTMHQLIHAHVQAQVCEKMLVSVMHIACEQVRYALAEERISSAWCGWCGRDTSSSSLRRAYPQRMELPRTSRASSMSSVSTRTPRPLMMFSPRRASQQATPRWIPPSSAQQQQPSPSSSSSPPRAALWVPWVVEHIHDALRSPLTECSYTTTLPLQTHADAAGTSSSMELFANLHPAAPTSVPPMFASEDEVWWMLHAIHFLRWWSVEVRLVVDLLPAQQVMDEDGEAPPQYMKQLQLHVVMPPSRVAHDVLVEVWHVASMQSRTQCHVHHRQ